jgi:hypothetical protein
LRQCGRGGENHRATQESEPDGSHARKHSGAGAEMLSKTDRIAEKYMSSSEGLRLEFVQ